MSLSDTWDALQVARDAREQGSLELYQQIIDGERPDFDYVRCSAVRKHPRFYRQFIDEAEQRDFAQMCKRIDWCAWTSLSSRSHGPRLTRSRTARSAFDPWIDEVSNVNSDIVDSALRAHEAIRLSGRVPQRIVMHPSAYDEVVRHDQNVMRGVMRSVGLEPTLSILGIPVETDPDCSRNEVRVTGGTSTRTARLTAMLKTALARRR